MSTYNLVLLLLIALVLAALLVLFLPARRSRMPAGPPAERDLTGPGPWSREDDRYWLGGLIYYNPADPEPFIPKRFGLGWTVNFGHPLGKVLLVVLIGMVLLPVILLLLGVQLTPVGCHPSGCSHPFPPLP